MPPLLGLNTTKFHLIYYVSVIRNFRTVVDIFNWHRSRLELKTEVYFLWMNVFPHFFFNENIYPTLIHRKLNMLSVATKNKKVISQSIIIVNDNSVINLMLKLQVLQELFTELWLSLLVTSVNYFDL